MMTSRFWSVIFVVSAGPSLIAQVTVPEPVQVASVTEAASDRTATNRDEPAYVLRTDQSGDSGNAAHQSAPAAEQRAYAIRHLEERLAYWQKQLQLDEWRLCVAMIRRDELRPNTVGKIRWDKRRKTAAIDVLDPADYSLAFRPMLTDMEFTIVHELVHLTLASLPRSEASRSQEEHAVNRITESLLRLDSRR